MVMVMDLLQGITLKKGDVIVLGCSSGPDSMALFDSLLRVRDSLSLSIICAHVNHNVRKASEKEQAFLEDYCKKHHVVMESLKIEKYGDDNFHNEARAIRYHFFDEVVKNYHATYLMTAHHGDDLMETVLMRIVRGSTLRGYSGFQKYVFKDSYTIVRPFIELTKEDLLTYNKQYRVPYFIDASNKKTKYTRNRYRKYVLPFLKSEDSHVHEHFLKYSELLMSYHQYVEQETKKSLKKVYRDGTIFLSSYLLLDPFLQDKVIYSILEDIYQDDLMLVSDKHVRLLGDLFHSKKSHSTLYLPNDMIVYKDGEKVTIRREMEDISQYEIELNDYVLLPNKKHLEIVQDEKTNGNDICRIDCSQVALPLSVRTRRVGDRMAIRPSGHKKVSDIFIDQKIPYKDRDIWPIVVDSRGEIIWIPGVKKSKKVAKMNEKYDIIIKYY